jgi:outer membrane protein TolC
VKRVREAHLKLAEAVAHARLVRDELAPKADVALRLAEARHAAGDLSLADVIAVRREAAAVRLAHLDALREVMEGWAELRPFLNP